MSIPIRTYKNLSPITPSSSCSFQNPLRVSRYRETEISILETHLSVWIPMIFKITWNDSWRHLGLSNCFRQTSNRWKPHILKEERLNSAFTWEREAEEGSSGGEGRREEGAVRGKKEKTAWMRGYHKWREEKGGRGSFSPNQVPRWTISVNEKLSNIYLKVKKKNLYTWWGSILGSCIVLIHRCTHAGCNENFIILLFFSSNDPEATCNDPDTCGADTTKLGWNL